MCSGTVTDPQKEYNLEFLTARTNLARDFEALLAEHEFAPHRTRRNGVNLIYVKTGANVERLLRFMGAADAATQISVLKAFKQVRNQTNRQNQLRYRKPWQNGAGERSDPEGYSAICRNSTHWRPCRRCCSRQQPSGCNTRIFRLTALCGCFDPAVSKSGLSHRMKSWRRWRKICASVSRRTRRPVK